MPPSSPEPSITYTSELALIDLDRVHHWIARKSYWAGQMPRQVFDRAVRGSLCFAALRGGVTVAFCRVITDRATFAYVADVFVGPNHRGQGLGKGLMRAVMAHPDLQGLRRFQLVTRDAHGLYKRFGLRAPQHPDRHMEIFRHGMYQRKRRG